MITLVSGNKNRSMLKFGVIERVLTLLKPNMGTTLLRIELNNYVRNNK